MKKFLSLIAVLLVMLAMATPALASTTFVPSVSYKDSPDVEDAQMNGEPVSECLEVSSVKDAEEKTTDIHQDDRDALLEVYEKLESGEMDLPLEEDYVIRELVDVSFKNSACEEADHGKEEWLAQEGNTLTVTFDLGVDADTEVTVLVYIDGQWVPALEVTNNGDGTVTVVFEDICPVAFCVAKEEDGPAKTGDVLGQDLTFWTALMAVSMGGILVLMLRRRRQA